MNGRPRIEPHAPRKEEGKEGMFFNYVYELYLFSYISEFFIFINQAYG
jgi:hypothetical protein